MFKFKRIWKQSGIQMELDAERQRAIKAQCRINVFICTPTYFHSANANKSARPYAKTPASLKRFMHIAMSCTQSLLFPVSEIAPWKKKKIIFWLSWTSILSSMNFVTYETLDRCPNDCEINCTIQFRPRMNSNEFREVNIMVLPDRSGFHELRLKDQWESHRSVAQSRRLCSKHREAN